jgi:hypothetical protein
VGQDAKDKFPGLIVSVVVLTKIFIRLTIEASWGEIIENLILPKKISYQRKIKKSSITKNMLNSGTDNHQLNRPLALWRITDWINAWTMGYMDLSAMLHWL